MKKNVLKLIVSVSVACLQTICAQTYTLTEVTDGGKLFAVSSKSINLLKKTVVQEYNMDINSSLRLKINKAKINEEAAAWIGNPVSIPFKRMEDLSKILAKRKELLESIDFGSANSLEERKKVLNNFAKTVEPLIDFIIDEMPNTPLYTRVNAIFASGSASENYSDFFDALSKEISDITEQYKAALEANKVYFRMGAFINKTPVHMEGFDTFKENEYYKVPRFATTINAEEKKRFDDAKEFATQANKDMAAAFRNRLKEAITPILKSLEDSIKKKFSVPLDSLQSGIQKSVDLSAEIKERFDEIQHDLDALQTNIKVLINAAKNTDDPNYISNLETNINTVITGYQRFCTSLDNDLSVLPDKAKSITATFNKSYESGKKVMTGIVSDIKVFFDDKTRLNISLSDKVNESLLKFGSEVNNIQLDNIPEETEINLLTAGDRKPGDQLYIKAVLSKQPVTTEAALERTIEFTHVGISQVGLHSTIKAVLLFADNTSSEFQAKKQFQLVPSYSVLFKCGTRYHSIYNKYIDLGVGVNMATLDFNNDNTPEIGIGVVGSVFRDYLQVGYGRNMSADQNYWFFGIRLPFIGVNLNGKTKVIEED